MIGVGLFVLFLVPGLLAYAAIYGLFHSGRSIAPEPPGVNTIEASVVILLCSAVVHAATTLAIGANAAICGCLACPVRVPAHWLDPYARTFDALEGKGIAARSLGGLLLLALAQGAAAYRLVRLWLRRRARLDRLPAWLYGWTIDLANAADDADKLVVAYVLTNHEVGGRAVIYGGLLFDLGLKADGSITRLTLWDCERYVADLGGSAGEPTLPDPSSRFPFMMIEASQVRNVAFRVVPRPDADPDLGGVDVAQPRPAPTSGP